MFKQSKTIALTLSIALLGSLGCNQEEKQPVTKQDNSGRPALTNEVAAVAAQVSPNDLKNSVPSTAEGFFVWDLENPAYERLLNSNWGKNSFTKFSALATQMPELTTVLEGAGISLTDPTSFRQKIKQILLVLGPSGTTNDQSIGLVFRAADPETAKKLVSAIGAEAAKEGGKFDAGANTFSMEIAGKGPTGGPSKLHNFTGKAVENRVVIADNDVALAALSEKPAQPRFTAPAYAKFAAGKTADQFLEGYINLAKLSSVAAGGDSSIQAAYVSASMTDRPVISLQLLKSKAGAPAVKATAPTKEMLAALPINPLLYAQFEVAPLNQAITANSQDAQKMMNDSQFAVIKSISQIALGAKLAGGETMAMLPIPEIVLTIQTAAPKEVAAKLLGAATGAAGMYGMPSQPSDKQIAGKTVHVLPGGFGVSLYLAELDNAIIAATTESLITDALTRATGSNPTAGQSAQLVQSVSSPQLGKFYLSFPEVAKLMRTAKTMIPPNVTEDPSKAELNNLLSEESIKQLEGLGTLVTSFTDEGEVYHGVLTYL